MSPAGWVGCSIALAGVLAGCVQPPAGPGTVDDWAGDIHVLLTADGTTLNVTLRNEGPASFSYSTGCGNHWFEARLLDHEGAERFVFPSRHHCLTVPPPRSFEPGETLTASVDWQNAAPDYEPAPESCRCTWHVGLRFNGATQEFVVTAPE